MQSISEKPAKVLVVGGSGYLGVEVVKALQKDGYAPVVIGRSANEAKERHYQGKMEDLHLLEKIYREHPCDTVVILAADKDAAKAAEDPVKCVQNNIANPFALLTKAIELGAKNIVFASSSLVYAPKDQPLQETDSLVTAGAYSKSKAIDEETLKLLITKKNKVRVCVARFSNLAGATEDSPAHAGVLTTFVKAARTGTEITMGGKNITGTFQSIARDFLHVSDAAAIVPKMVARMRAQEGDAFEVVNVGSGVATSLQTLVEAIQKLPSLKTSPIKTNPDPQAILQVSLDVSKAKTLYGWQPEYSSPDKLVKSEAAYQERQQAKQAKEARAQQLAQQRSYLIRGVGFFGVFCAAAKVATNLLASSSPAHQLAPAPQVGR